MKSQKNWNPPLLIIKIFAHLTIVSGKRTKTSISKSQSQGT